MTAILQETFEKHFFEWKLYFDKVYPKDFS